MSRLADWRGKAPAKVNLRLAVLAREPSGYHRVETVLQALKLSDRIELKFRDDQAIGLDLEIAHPDALGPAEQNLAVRAARAFRHRLEGVGSTCPGVQIALEKDVPHGAGLGGGSSDAAAVLRGLNELLGEPLSGDELMQVGATLGADVPFFVSGAARALARGRGDGIYPVEPLPERDVLVVVPSKPVSTRWAYETLAAQRETEGARLGHDQTRGFGAGRAWPSAEAEWGEVEAHARNDFEEVLFPLRPELAGIKEILQVAGARPALLSGSGSALFGVFGTGEAAGTAEAAIRTEAPGVRTILTHTLS